MAATRGPADHGAQVAVGGSACHGALLRLPVDAGAWAEDLPPVPDGCRVTVSFSSDDACTEHAEALQLLGYTVVGVLQTAGPPCADVVIEPAVATGHPTFWRSLGKRADRAYNLAAGPVAGLLAPQLALHRQVTGAIRPRPAPAR